MTRVLVIDHTAGIIPFRRKFSALAAQPGLELTVLAPSRWIENYRPVLAEPGNQDGFRLLTGPVIWPGYENRGFFTRGIRRALRQAKPELLHLWEEPYSLITLQSLLIRGYLAPRARVIFSSSDDRSLGFRYPYRPSWLYGAIERFTLRRADGATVINEGVRALLRTKGFQRPTELITHGLDLEDYPCTLRTRAALPVRGKRPVVGYFGRLTWQKGVDVLLESFARFRTHWKGEAPLLRIVGDGPERRTFEALAGELGLHGQVEFHPTVPHSEAPRVLSQFDLLVLPSRTVPTSRETFGRVLIEGMAAGCVVIGSDSGAIPEVLGDAGVIVPEGDAEALAGALERVLADPELAGALRARGGARVRERYTWAKIAGRLAGFYRMVLEEPV
jgi:glycosyltransferase involved in cell wall biosynthesis